MDNEFDYIDELETEVEKSRSDRKVYRATIAALVMAVALLGLALFHTREVLTECIRALS